MKSNQSLNIANIQNKSNQNEDLILKSKNFIKPESNKNDFYQISTTNNPFLFLQRNLNLPIFLYF